MQENLFFYYSNDLHSHFENWPGIVNWFGQNKKAKKQNNQSCWLIDIGDHMDRSHPIAEASKGRANVELLNEAGFDLATIGNNEGITLDYPDLYHLYDEADFDLVCANLTSMKEKDPFWLKPAVIKRSVQGVRVGFLGLTAPFHAFYSLLGWQVDHPFDVLDQQLPSLAAESDIVVLLSHLGINEDEEIARRYQEVDLIIGGHTHHLFRYGEDISGTLLTAAGKHGKYCGEACLTWDHSKKKLVKKESYTISTDKMIKDRPTEAKLRELQTKADKQMNQTVVRLEGDLEFSWTRETPVMKKLVETLQEWTEADCAMLNAGILLDQFKRGKVTMAGVHRICPHPMNPCLVSLKGDELLEVVRASLTRQFTELKLKGFGFRGEVLGRMVFAGMEVVTVKDTKGEEHVTRVSMDGSPVEMDQSYLVATADTFTFGRLLPEVARAHPKRYFMPEFLRDLLAETLKRHFQQ